MSLFRTKSIDALIAASEEPEKKLRRSLGPWSLTALGIGAVIGSGIFTLTGTAAAGKVIPVKNILEATVLDLLVSGSAAHSQLGRPGAGPAITLSFLLVAFACLFAGLCYAELASMIPDRRQRVHLLVRDFGRDRGLDYRLGPDSGIRRLQHVGGGRVLRLPAGPLREYLRLPIAAGTGLPSIPGGGRAQGRLQRACPGDHAAGDLGPGPGRTRKRPRQYDHGGDQDRGHPDFLRGRSEGDQSHQLAPVRAPRLLRRADRRLHRFLHLHRLRQRLHRRRGVPQPAARPAVRHHRDPDRMYDSVRVGVAGADRHHELHQAGHRFAGRRRPSKRWDTTGCA